MTSHVSLPRVFSTGNFKEWIVRFKICADSNGWEEAKRHTKIATFLEGEALAVYLELTDVDKEDFEKIVAALEKNFHPDTEHINTMATFNSRDLLPNETPRVYLHVLKELLKCTDIDATAHEKLVFYRFVSGLPSDISTQIKAMSGITTSQAALEAAQRIISVKSKEARPESAAVSIGSERSALNELEELKASVAALTMRVDELLRERPVAETAAVVGGRRPIICFRCGKPGHPARLCRAPPASNWSQSGNHRGRGAAATPLFDRAYQGSARQS